MSTDTNLDTYFQIILPILLFSVGCSLGDFDIRQELVNGRRHRHLLFPIVSILGSIAGGIIYTLIFRAELGQSVLAAGSMGFYSLPAIMVSGQLGTVAGTLVLVVNMLREVVTILFAPVIKRFFGNNSLVAVGGATTMDVSLSVIKETVGSDYVPLSIINGVILTITVPFVVSFILYII